MEYRRQSHVLYYTRYHLVFVTKYRRKVLKSGMGAFLKLTMRSISKIFPDVEIIEQNTDQDHIHLLVSIPPKRSVSEVVRYMKGRSAHVMRRKFPFLNKVYYGADGIWSDGYFVSTIGADEETIRRYIEYQGREDGGQAKLEL